MIFQEHTLAPHLTVAENIYLGTEPTGRLGILKNHAMTLAAREILQPPRLFAGSRPLRVGRLTTAQKQMVEIARALTVATKVVVMDEPTSMLSQAESEELFRIIRDLSSQGMAVVYISHRMEELPRIAHRITILRDGRRVFSGDFASIGHAMDIVRYMVGREIKDLYPPRPAPAPGYGCWKFGDSVKEAIPQHFVLLDARESIGIGGFGGCRANRPGSGHLWTGPSRRRFHSIERASRSLSGVAGTRSRPVWRI